MQLFDSWTPAVAGRLKLSKATRALVHPPLCTADLYNLGDMFPFEFCLICYAAAATWSPSSLQLCCKQLRFETPASPLKMKRVTPPLTDLKLLSRFRIYDRVRSRWASRHPQQRCEHEALSLSCAYMTFCQGTGTSLDRWVFAELIPAAYFVSCAALWSASQNTSIVGTLNSNTHSQWQHAGVDGLITCIVELGWRQIGWRRCSGAVGR